MSKETLTNLIWIHCYKCFEIFIKKQRQFFLLECRHILCGSCLSVEKKKTVCPICAEQTGFLAIGNNMPKHFRMLFHPNPSQFKDIDWRVVTFQNDARKHLTMGLLKMVSLVWNVLNKEIQYQNLSAIVCERI